MSRSSRRTAGRSSSRAMGEPARQAARGIDLRPAFALRPCDGDRVAGSCSRSVDDALSRRARSGCARSAPRRDSRRSDSDERTPRRPARLSRSALTAEIDARSASARPAAATAWCGAAAQADRAPNGVAGNPVHWIYLIPSDGTDGLGPVANAMRVGCRPGRRLVAGPGSELRPPERHGQRPQCGTQLDVTDISAQRTASRAAGTRPDLESVLRHHPRRSNAPLPYAADEKVCLVYYDEQPINEGRAVAAGAGVTRTASGSRSSITAVHRRSRLRPCARARIPPHDRRGAERCPKVHGQKHRAPHRRRGRPLCIRLWEVACP